jgi:outer membrane receptor protein involved in Fe transport
MRPRDLSLGVAFNYVSERQGSLEPEELALRLPAYVRADVFASWRPSARLRFDFRVENLADERYVRGSQSDALHLMPGMPRTFRGELTLSF